MAFGKNDKTIQETEGFREVEEEAWMNEETKVIEMAVICDNGLVRSASFYDNKKYE